MRVGEAEPRGLPASAGRTSAPPPIWTSARRAPAAAGPARRADRHSPSSRPRGRPRASSPGWPGRCRRARARRARRRREAVEVEPVIAQRHPLGAGARAPRDARGPLAVQVTAQSAAASFSRFSQSGVVQMSLACAETLQPQPASSARRSAPPRPACAGNARAVGRHRPAARPPAPAPGQSGGCGSGVGSRRRSASQARRAAR